MCDKSFKKFPLLEWLFVGAIAAGLLWSAWYFFTYRYLPQPWFYEPSGTLMDWYSLVIWGHVPGAYDIAGTIYPPLSFVILKVFSNPNCYPRFEAEWARACDPIGVYALLGILLVNALITFKTFCKIDRRTYIPRALALSFGFPMMFALERGNLLLFCYTALILGCGPLLKSARLRWLFAGAAVNFKVYLIGVAAAPLLRRRWTQAEGIIIALIFVYLTTWAILGEGSPSQIFRNVTTYIGGFGAGGVLDLWYAGSFIPAISLLKGETFPVTSVLDSDIVDMSLLAVTIYLRLTQALIIFAAIAVWLRPEVVPPSRTYYLAISLALSSSEAGGYTQLLLLLFVFMEPWRGNLRKIAIVCAYLLCIPVEYRLSQIAPMARVSWLWDGGASVIVDYGVGLVAFIRLFLNYFITILLAVVTIKEVWLDVKSQGRAGRWRYRNDAPILPNIDTPSQGRLTR